MIHELENYMIEDFIVEVVGHPFSNGDVISLETTESLPENLNSNTQYIVKVYNEDGFELSEICTVSIEGRDEIAIQDRRIMESGNGLHQIIASDGAKYACKFTPRIAMVKSGDSFVQCNLDTTTAHTPTFVGLTGLKFLETPVISRDLPSDSETELCNTCQQDYIYEEIDDNGEILKVVIE